MIGAENQSQVASWEINGNWPEMKAFLWIRLEFEYGAPHALLLNNETPKTIKLYLNC